MNPPEQARTGGLPEEAIQWAELARNDLPRVSAGSVSLGNFTQVQILTAPRPMGGEPWPGVRADDVLVALIGLGAYTFSAGSFLHGSYVAEKLGVGQCDGTALALLLAIVLDCGAASSCDCARHREGVRVG